MKPFTELLALHLALLFSLPLVVVAGERATMPEAQELVARAISLYDEGGEEKAFATFENGTDGFIDHDLYIFVFGPERTIVAHGGDAALVGTPAATLVDVDGVPFGNLFMDTATETGRWVDYKWRDPVTDEVYPKSSWVVLHKGHVFGAGVYKP